MHLNRNPPMFVTGQRGMGGSAIVRRLQAGGHDSLLLRTRTQAAR